MLLKTNECSAEKMELEKDIKNNNNNKIAIV